MRLKRIENYGREYVKYYTTENKHDVIDASEMN